RQLARRLLDRFHTLIIDRTIADLAAALRRRNDWKIPDALQAAVAKHHKLKIGHARYRRLFAEALPLCSSSLHSLITCLVQQRNWRKDFICNIARLKIYSKPNSEQRRNEF